MISKDYKQLIVWQKSMDLTIIIYSLVKFLPRDENYALSDQMRRAAVSIPSNIAEGQGRASDKEYVHFLAMARGSLWELLTQLEICERLNYLKTSQTMEARNLVNEISRMINALSKALQTPKN
jgi:four helix bundle protein